MNTNQHERLRQARVEAGYRSAAAAAEAHGWNVSTYRHHENGTRGYAQDHAKAYARAFKVSAIWLLGLQSDPKPEVNEYLAQSLNTHEPLASSLADLDEMLREEAGQALVHRFKMSDFNGFLATDFPLFHDRDQDFWFKAFDVDLLTQLAKVEPVQICTIYVSDGSMAPTIKEGASILIDTGATEIEQQDAIWLISIGETAMIRRVFVRPGGTLAISADSITNSFTEFERYDVQIHGKVVWIGQSV